MLWIAVNLHVKENICITIYIAHLKEEVVLFLLTVCQQWVWVFTLFNKDFNCLAAVTNRPTSIPYLYVDFYLKQKR